MKKRMIAVLTLACGMVLALTVSAALLNVNDMSRRAEAAVPTQTPESDKFAQIEMIYNALLENYYEKPDSQALIEGAIEGMLGAVDDPYTFYYTAEEWASALSDNEGVYAGIGIQVLDQAEASAFMITRSFKDSPAYRAGLKAGDLLVAVDGFSVAKALGGEDKYMPLASQGAADDGKADSTEDDAVQPDGDTAQPNGDAQSDSDAQPDSDSVQPDVTPAQPANRTELLAYMRGEEGSEVTLTILRDGEYFDCTLKREIIHVNRVEYCMLEGGEGAPKVGYMVIYEFQGDAAEGVQEALNHFEQQGAQAVIVDLRNNPGGELNCITSISDAMLPEGLYAYIEDRHGNRHEFFSDDRCWGKPMAVLVNGYSASASELFTGAAKDMGAAVIVGETTFGKGIVQSVQGLPDGSGFQMTTARYFTPSGHVIQGNGIAPNIEVKVEYTPDQVTLGNMIAEGDLDWQKYDEQLLAAYGAVVDMVEQGWALPEMGGNAADAPNADDAEGANGADAADAGYAEGAAYAGGAWNF